MLLNDQIKNKAKQTREESKSFETSLASEFKSLTDKTGENLDKVNEQLDLLIKSAEKENEIANRVAVLSAMFSKNALLERLVFTKIEDKLSSFPKRTEDVEIKEDTPKKKSKTKGLPTYKPPKSPKKMASGGVTPGKSADAQQKTNKELIPYSQTLALSLQASGIAAITTLGEFIKGTGALGGFFSPYVKSVVKPFAAALGVGGNIVNTLLGGPVQAATLDLNRQQKHFSKMWGKYLNDPTFVNQYIDREASGDSLDPNNPSGYVPAKWDEDPEFVALVNAFAKEWNLNAAGLLALMASESGLRPNAENSGGCVGLIQFCPGGGLDGTGKTAAELKAMTRSQQWSYVTNYWIKSGLEKGMTAGDLYGLTHVPSFYKAAVKGKPVGSVARMEAVTTVAGEPEYDQNKRLDYNKDGKITVRDYDEEVRRVGKSFGIKYESGGFKKKRNIIDSTPFLLSGSYSGYKRNLFGTEVELHGDEVIVPGDQGFYVFPVANRRYNFWYDFIKQNLFGERGDGTIERWKQIAKGTFNSGSTFSAGGSADFWKMAAISATEDKRHPQGQADVAQSIYNRVAIGSYPGGKDIGSIITAEGQYEPTFGNSAKWKAIRDRKSAIAAVGSSKLVDMASRSITDPALQSEARRFIGGRTDFQGESQKSSMKPGDITRGKNHNFFGWFYDAKLPKAAPIPRTIATPNKQKPTVVVNRISTPSQPNIIQQTQGAITQFTNMIFNPHRVKKELSMKRV